MQIRQQILQLLLVELITESRHHASPMENTLHCVLICCRQPAGQVLLFKKLLQTRPFVAFGRIGRMAVHAVNIEDLAALGLLRIQSQLGITHFCGIFTAPGQQARSYHHQKNGRYLPQVSIMSRA